MTKLVSLNKPTTTPLTLAEIKENKQFHSGLALMLNAEIQKKHPGYEFLEIVEWDTERESLLVKIQNTRGLGGI